MKMKGNVKQKMKTTRRMLLIVGVSSILGITIMWFLFYTFSGSDKLMAGKDNSAIATKYIENENLTDFEVKEARLRAPDDPVLKGTARYKNTQEVSN